MKAKPRLLLVVLASGTVALPACNDDGGYRGTDGDADADTDTDADTDSDTDPGPDSGADSGADTDVDSDTDSDDCPADGTWLDTATGLCWQNPPFEYSMWGGDSAAEYCDDLSIGGHDDWRLPVIQELISLLRGCVDGTATGDLSTSECAVSDPDCLGSECDDSGCAICSEVGGPDDDPAGCYWPQELEGDCWAYWSSSVYDGDETHAWRVMFEWGNASGFDVEIQNMVRCVHDAP
jgi:hypothetical protein